MGKVYEHIDEVLEAFILAQQMFFVATAPLNASGHVNLSPKGLDTLRVLGPRTMAYLDYVGSGAETIGHLRENGRRRHAVCVSGCSTHRSFSWSRRSVGTARSRIQSPPGIVSGGAGWSRDRSHFD